MDQSLQSAMIYFNQSRTNQIDFITEKIKQGRTLKEYESIIINNRESYMMWDFGPVRHDDNIINIVTIIIDEIFRVGIENVCSDFKAFVESTCKMTSHMGKNSATKTWELSVDVMISFDRGHSANEILDTLPVWTEQVNNWNP